MRKRKHKLSTTPTTATISSLSHDGRGIAHINDKITFISGALPHEQVAFIYTKKRANHDEGQLSRIIIPSPDRVTPLCQHFDLCGGCSLQHISPQDQLSLKQNVLLEQLQHFGQVSPDKILPPITGPQWQYRCKARLGVKFVAGKDKVLVGFREKNPRFVANLSTCHILHQPVDHLITPLSELLYQLSIRDKIPQIEVAISDETTALIIRHLDTFSESDCQIIKDFAQQYHVAIYLQPKGPETIHKLFPEDDKTLLHYHLADQSLTFSFHPTDFTQINPIINQKMVNQALAYLDPQADENILDLFCGLGNFTLPIAKFCHTVVGVEGDDTMVKRAKDNAAHNQITNAQFYSANLFQPLAQQWSQQHYDKILLDPPRTGAIEVIENHIENFQATKIIYISCNPATLARDAGILVSKKGYKLEAAGILDMFPHTTHVESMAVLTKK